MIYFGNAMIWDIIKIPEYFFKQTIHVNLKHVNILAKKIYTVSVYLLAPSQVSANQSNMHCMYGSELYSSHVSKVIICFWCF